MTERLYYTDPYLRKFDAIVQDVEPLAAGTAVFLDRTAFYPTSGGQPFDIGTLGGLAVVDVVDRDDGRIAHVVDAARDAVASLRGQRLEALIDWQRRFDHMQQHSGQHVLSAAFDRLFSVGTVSFHLGAAAATIDLAREVSVDGLHEAESLANQIVWENRPVAIRFVSAEDAARLPLRKEPARHGTLRLIDVDDFDLSACGGTHVERTGAIGVIAISGWERFKGGYRVEFLCGGRALTRFRTFRDAMASSVRLLSVLPGELPQAIEKVQAEAKAQKRVLGDLENELARYRAEELTSAAEETPAGRLVLRSLAMDANGLKALAAAVAARPGYIAALVSESSPRLFVVARSADLAPGVDARKLVSSLTAQFGGRGGGRPELAQAGGIEGPVDAILAAARARLTTEVF